MSVSEWRKACECEYLSDVWLRFAGAHRLQFSDQIGLIIRENRQTFGLSKKV